MALKDYDTDDILAEFDRRATGTPSVSLTPEDRVVIVLEKSDARLTCWALVDHTFEDSALTERAEFIADQIDPEVVACPV